MPMVKVLRRDLDDPRQLGIEGLVDQPSLTLDLNLYGRRSGDTRFFVY